MPRIVESTVYQFDELSEDAKERARAWYREGALDHNWWDSVYEDAAECGKILGIDLNTKPVKLMGGGTRYDPCIYFSGFCSQGDGACFEGVYSYAKGAAKKIREHAPQDTDLHNIADALQAVQRQNFYRLEARTRHVGHYSHSGCMSVDVFGLYGRDVNRDAEESVTQCLRDFADWIYARLKQEYEFQLSDEIVDDTIRANEYEFDAEGNRD